MTSMRWLAVGALPLLVLAGCGDNEPEAPPPPSLPTENAATVAPAPVDQPTPPGESLVIEAEPQVGGAEPMDSAAPMNDAAPMSDPSVGEFSANPVQ